jgi:hypothetical protein
MNIIPKRSMDRAWTIKMVNDGYARRGFTKDIITSTFRHFHSQ